MHLYRPTVESYRALRIAQLAFDAPSVLIGENDCGKSPLLEALAIALESLGRAGRGHGATG
ncbi:MAG: YjbD family protein [Chromatiaceae bacterium]|jgi:predicted ATP-dependent endonuclease of OLD family|nr:YjbD family protein [Chromatiaceae bacterium]